MKIPAGWEEYADFRSKTVHERAKLLAASGKQDRLDMTAAHVLALLERYPVLFREAWVAPTNQASRFAQDGFDIGGGWFDIVDRLSVRAVLYPAFTMDDALGMDRARRPKPPRAEEIWPSTTWGPAR